MYFFLFFMCRFVYIYTSFKFLYIHSWHGLYPLAIHSLCETIECSSSFVLKPQNNCEEQKQTLITLSVISIRVHQKTNTAKKINNHISSHIMDIITIIIRAISMVPPHNVIHNVEQGPVAFPDRTRLTTSTSVYRYY